MRINPLTGDAPINAVRLNETSQMTGAFQTEKAEVRPTLIQEQVQLFLDSQIKMLLSELTKLLTEQTAELKKMPCQVASRAKALIEQPLFASEVIPGGMTAILKGKKIAVQNLSSMANAIDDAVMLKQYFPEGLPEVWQSIMTKFANQSARLPNFSEKYILELAGQLAECQVPVSDAPFILHEVGRQLLSKIDTKELGSFSCDSLDNLSKVLEKVITEFSGQLVIKGGLGNESLVFSLRQTVEQFIQELATESTAQAEGALGGEKYPVLASGLPAIMDDIFERFESLLSSKEPVQEKAVLVANLRQMALQLTNDMPPKEKVVFQNLVRLFKDIMPINIQQAVILNEFPELVDLWTLSKLKAASEWLQMVPDSLNHAGRSLRELAVAVQRFTEKTGESEVHQNGMTMVIPLYFGSDTKPYPVYIHIFKDAKQHENGGVFPEVWLRLCFVTENIGVVDSVFHIFGNNKLNIKIGFSDINTAEKFKNIIPGIQKNICKSKLSLIGINVVSLLPEDRI